MTSEMSGQRSHSVVGFQSFLGSCLHIKPASILCEPLYVSPMHKRVSVPFYGLQSRMQTGEYDDNLSESETEESTTLFFLGL